VKKLTPLEEYPLRTGSRMSASSGTSCSSSKATESAAEVRERSPLEALRPVPPGEEHRVGSGRHLLDHPALGMGERMLE